MEPSGHAGAMRTMFATAVAVSPDGRTLASLDSRTTVRLWSVALPPPAVAARELCAGIGRDLTVRERALYLPGDPGARACPAGRAGT